MKPMLKAAGTKCMKVKHDTLVLKFCFRIQLALLYRGGIQRVSRPPSRGPLTRAGGEETLAGLARAAHRGHDKRGGVYLGWAQRARRRTHGRAVQVIPRLIPGCLHLIFALWS
jgi:hypothetical protein